MARPPSPGLAVRPWSVALLVGVCGSLLVPAACRTPAPRAEPGAPVRVAIGYGGPRQGSVSALRVLGSLLSRETLVELGRDGRAAPALAERWEQSADGLTWRFFLRPDLTFHDGSPIDAAIVGERLRECGRQGMNVGCRDLLSVEADGSRAVVIRLGAPSGLLLDSLGSVIITPNGAPDISAGPFRKTADGQQSYAAFRGYYQGPPGIDLIDFKSFPNARNAWTALMRNEIDMLYEVAPEALEFIEQSSNTQVRSFLRPFVFTLLLNVRRPVLASRDTRRALNLAVNRTELITRVFRGRGYPATDHVWPRHWAYHHELPRLRYDPTQAIELLEAQGLKMPVAAPDARTPSSRFRFTCLIPENDDRFERMSLLLQQQFLDVGIDMEIEPVSVTALGTRATSGDYDAFLVDLRSQTGLDWIYQLWHAPEGGPIISDAGYRAADPALDRLRRARTDEDVRLGLESLQRVMRDDPPAVFLLWSEQARAVSARFRVPLSPDRDIFTTLPEWRLAPPAEP